MIGAERTAWSPVATSELSETALGDVAKKKIGKPCKACGGTERYVGSGHCVPCHIRDSREWATRNPERHAQHQSASWDRRAYGLDLGGRDAMLARQGGRCAICGTIDSGKTGWHLDHDHRFAANDRRGHRALLCPHCNKGLGHFHDNPTHLRAAADYLDAHEARLAA